jgi:hypothetical protein
MELLNFPLIFFSFILILYKEFGKELVIRKVRQLQESLDVGQVLSNHFHSHFTEQDISEVKSLSQGDKVNLWQRRGKLLDLPGRVF